MITPRQRAELRRLRAVLPQQELFFDYFASPRQMMAYDADRNHGMTHIADESANDDTSAWLLYVSYAATVAPALLDALDAAEARANAALATQLRHRYNELSLLLVNDTNVPESVTYSRSQQMHAISTLLRQLPEE